MSWPDYMTKKTLARRIDLAEGAVDQYVKRGLLPPPVKIGEALLWRWVEVDAALKSGNAREVTNDDPYIRGVNAAEAPASRQMRP